MPGSPGVRVLDDGWTAVTRDGGLSAHFEHSVAVTASGPEVLSRRPDETVADVDDACGAPVLVLWRAPLVS